MIPYVLISSDEIETQLFIKNYINKNNIRETHAFDILPEAVEFSVKQIREIKKDLIHSMNEPRLYILRQFHKSSFEAQNAFLKTLEEHTENVHFILSVSNIHNLLPTIKSRSKIVYLSTSRKAIGEDKRLDNAISHLIEKGDNSIFQLLTIKTLDADQSMRSITNLFIYFFKKRLSYDVYASKVLNEIINAYYAFENNHIDSQLTIDHILLYIRKTYHSSLTIKK